MHSHGDFITSQKHWSLILKKQKQDLTYCIILPHIAREVKTFRTFESLANVGRIIEIVTDIE